MKNYWNVSDTDYQGDLENFYLRFISWYFFWNGQFMKILMMKWREKDKRTYLLRYLSNFMEFEI